VAQTTRVPHHFGGELAAGKPVMAIPAHPQRTTKKKDRQCRAGTTTGPSRRMTRITLS